MIYKYVMWLVVHKDTNLSCHVGGRRTFFQTVAEENSVMLIYFLILQRKRKKRQKEGGRERERFEEWKHMREKAIEEKDYLIKLIEVKLKHLRPLSS